MAAFTNFAKTDFTGDVDLDFLVSVPGTKNSSCGIDNQCLRVRGHELVMVFEPIAETICELVRKQVQFSGNAAKVNLFFGGAWAEPLPSQVSSRGIFSYLDSGSRWWEICRG
ncbi:hypothetical protein BDV23DRAFT_188847 [Aspergillus alliaceus]|uniref:Uncharacterized protein n=1 Tax=Petromyces alliaceus TaxID=209559 RepID=A0A5N7BST8_PETAA|nr:hypothetical protein BDV23DRAFT_188847 [Aspergillus alliaceus]